MDWAGGRNVMVRGGEEGLTFTVVRPSNVKDLICPFSRKTFSTLGMSRRASFFNMSWHVGPAKGEERRVGGTERQREGGERESGSDGVLLASSAALGFCAKRHISPENPAFCRAIRKHRQFRAA